MIKLSEVVVGILLVHILVAVNRTYMMQSVCNAQLYVDQY